MTKRAIALDGVLTDPVPWEVLQAAFMYRRWELVEVYHAGKVFESRIMCANRVTHYEVGGNEVRYHCPCNCASGESTGGV